MKIWTFVQQDGTPIQIKAVTEDDSQRILTAIASKDMMWLDFVQDDGNCFLLNLTTVRLIFSRDAEEEKGALEAVQEPLKASEEVFEKA